MTVTALVARRIGRVVVVDLVWGLGFVLVALVCALVGDAQVRWLLLVMVAVWGLRLAWHVGRRVFATSEEDPRYAAMLEGKSFGFAVRRVFLTQGIAMWFVSLPVQVAAGIGVTRPRTSCWGSAYCSGWSGWSSSRWATRSWRRTRRTRTAAR